MELGVGLGGGAESSSDHVAACLCLWKSSDPAFALCFLYSDSSHLRYSARTLLYELLRVRHTPRQQHKRYITLMDTRFNDPTESLHRQLSLFYLMIKAVMWIVRYSILCKAYVSISLTEPLTTSRLLHSAVTSVGGIRP